MLEFEAAAKFVLMAHDGHCQQRLGGALQLYFYSNGVGGTKFSGQDCGQASLAEIEGPARYGVGHSGTQHSDVDWKGECITDLPTAIRRIGGGCAHVSPDAIAIQQTRLEFRTKGV
jgi:hypothetical protein